MASYCQAQFWSLNPTYNGGGGWFPPPPLPRFLDSGAFNIDLRGPRFWYNSYFIVTMKVQNVQNLKGVPEKNYSVISETGVKIQKFKLPKKNLKDILREVIIRKKKCCEFSQLGGASQKFDIFTTFFIFFCML